jgi:hypothetical protein
MDDLSAFAIYYWGINQQNSTFFREQSLVRRLWALAVAGYNEFEGPVPLKRTSLFVVRDNTSPGRAALHQFVQCPTCAQFTLRTKASNRCAVCGARLGASTYSGNSLELVTGHPPVHVKLPYPANHRRYPRIPCANVKACVKAGEASRVIVEVVNISRGGVCFLSSEQFSPGTVLSIATHYVEGGQNIFQLCQILWAKPGEAGAPGKCGAKFAVLPR